MIGIRILENKNITSQWGPGLWPLRICGRGLLKPSTPYCSFNCLSHLCSYAWASSAILLHNSSSKPITYSTCQFVLSLSSPLYCVRVVLYRLLSILWNEKAYKFYPFVDIYLSNVVVCELYVHLLLTKHYPLSSNDDCSSNNRSHDLCMDDEKWLYLTIALCIW